MAKLTDKEKALLNDLQHKDTAVNLDAIRRVKSEGGDFVIEAVFDLYQRSEDDSLDAEILELISQINQRTVAENIIHEVLHRKLGDKLAAMLNAIWQSRLDFHPHIKELMRFVPHEDYRVCMEALFIIEMNFIKASTTDQQEVLSQLMKLTTEAPDKAQQELIMSFIHKLD